MRGKLKHVSASGNGYIWEVNSARQIYKCKKPCSGGWVHVDGTLNQIDAGNQYVYNVNHHQVFYFRPVDDSEKWQKPRNNYKAKYVTATGDNKVYIVGTDNKVYHCNAPCSNGRWTKLSDDTLTQIEGSVQLLVGRNGAEQLYYQCHLSKGNLIVLVLIIAQSFHITEKMVGLELTNKRL